MPTFDRDLFAGFEAVVLTVPSATRRALSREHASAKRPEDADPSLLDHARVTSALAIAVALYTRSCVNVTEVVSFKIN